MKIKFQEKIVAFVDVLGFSNLVNSQSDQKLNQYFTFVSNDLKAAVKESGFKYMIISDSIVISIDIKLEKFELLLKILTALQAKLLLHGILLRGSVSIGDLYINKTNNILVGSGLIKAYKLEQGASYPRIIIDRSLIKKFFNNTYCAVETIRQIRIKNPDPYVLDYPFLDYAENFFFNGSIHKFDKFLIHFNNYYYQNEYIEKFEWFRNYFLDCIGEQLKFYSEKKKLGKSDNHKINVLRYSEEKLRLL